MRKIIINNNHLRHLYEENSVNIATQAKDNNLSSFVNVASNSNTQSDIQKASVAGDVNLVVNGPKTNDSQPTQQINVAAGDTLQNALTTQANDELIRNGGSVKITGDGLGETIVFTKKQLKEVRLANIKKNGRVLSKKDLIKTFF
jgi:hypothetical protein